MLQTLLNFSHADNVQQAASSRATAINTAKVRVPARRHVSCPVLPVTMLSMSVLVNEIWLAS